MNIENDFCNIKFHRQSLRGRIQDYIISFTDKQVDLQDVVLKTDCVFQQLMDYFKNTTIRARIVAQVEFIRPNNEVCTFHFASFSSELVTQDFYSRHMQKIGQRLDEFNKNGSNLLIHCIKHIHLQLEVPHHLS